LRGRGQPTLFHGLAEALAQGVGRLLGRRHTAAQRRRLADRVVEFGADVGEVQREPQDQRRVVDLLGVRDRPGGLCAGVGQFAAGTAGVIVRFRDL